MRKSFLAALVALFLFNLNTTAIAPSKPKEIDESRFIPVKLRPINTHSVVIRDRWLSDSPDPAPRPKINRKAIPIIKDLTPEPPKVDNGGGTRINGVASWYCLAGVSRCTYTHSGGNYAAIRRDLLFLRGDTIGVCTDPRNCIRVTIIDCNCGPNANLIDLYSDAFRQLAPLSVGKVRVYIEY